MTAECPNCQGQGRMLMGVNYVSRDMATDAGEPAMEGMPMEDWAACPYCGGGGVVEIEGTPKGKDGTG